MASRLAMRVLCFAVLVALVSAVVPEAPQAPQAPQAGLAPEAPTVQVPTGPAVTTPTTANSPQTANSPNTVQGPTIGGGGGGVGGPGTVQGPTIGGGATPQTQNGGGATPQTQNGGGATPQTQNGGGATPQTQNGGGATPQTQNGGGATPQTQNGGATPQTPRTTTPAASVSATFGLAVPLATFNTPAKRAEFEGAIESLPGVADATITSVVATVLGKKFGVQVDGVKVTTLITADPGVQATALTNVVTSPTALATAFAGTSIPTPAVPTVTVVSGGPPAVPAIPANPLPPTQPAVAPSATGVTTGSIEVTILGTRSAFTSSEQTALTSAVANAINGTAAITNIVETSTARKFTVQASALRVTMTVSAPAAQYPSLAAIVARLNAVVRSQGGRIGNSAVVTVNTPRSGAAAGRSGPVAMTLVAAMLVALLF